MKTIITKTVRSKSIVAPAAAPAPAMMGISSLMDLDGVLPDGVLPGGVLPGVD